MNIVEYDEIRRQLDAVKEACNFIADPSSKEGYEKSRRVSLDVGKLKTALDNTRKNKKAYYLEGGKQVDSQARLIKDELDRYQAPHMEAYKGVDAAKKEREATRKADLERRVTDIRDLPDNMRDSDSEGIRMAMEDMRREECSDFYEFTKVALEARNHARDKLSEMFIKALASEKEAIELKKLREEKAARDKADYDDNLKREAKANAEAEISAAIKREEDAKQAQLDAELAKAEAEKRVVQAQKQGKIDADIAAEKARLAEIKKQELENQRIAMEEDRLRNNKEHAKVVSKEIEDCLLDLGCAWEQAVSIRNALKNNKIPHVKIDYSC